VSLHVSCLLQRVVQRARCQRWLDIVITGRYIIITRAFNYTICLAAIIIIHQHQQQQQQQPEPCSSDRSLSNTAFGTSGIGDRSMYVGVLAIRLWDGRGNHDNHAVCETACWRWSVGRSFAAAAAAMSSAREDLSSLWIRNYKNSLPDLTEILAANMNPTSASIHTNLDISVTLATEGSGRVGRQYLVKSETCGLDSTVFSGYSCTWSYRACSLDVWTE